MTDRDSCGGEDCFVANNNIGFNNWAGFLPGWEAGGGKLARTTRLIVRGNVIHHNFGPGIWTDIDNVDATYLDNFVYKNLGEGIKHEISYNAVIRNNTVCNNGRGQDVWLWGSQVLIQNSQNVFIADNLIVVKGVGNGIGLIQQSRGNGSGPGYGPHLARNNTVTGNEIVFLQNRGFMMGAVADFEAPALFEQGGNVFNGNLYHVGAGDHAWDAVQSRRWTWNGTALDFARWQSYAFDLGGAVDRLVPAGLPAEYL